MEHSKTCTSCGQVLAISYFSPSKLGLYGVRSKCRPCQAKASKDYRKRNPEKVKQYNDTFRAQNPDKVKAANKRFREMNPDYAKNYHATYRELENLRGRQNYAADKAKQSLRKKLDRQNNPDRYRERNRRYAENNQDKLNEKSQRRRAYKANAKTFVITKREIQRLYNAKCFYCERKADTLDHVIPLSRGGDHGIGNLVSACGPCNFSKAGRTVMEWRVWKVRLSGLPL